MADGIRTRDTQIYNQDVESSKGVDNKRLRTATPPIARHLPTDTWKTNSDLATLVAAWAELPEAIRAGIIEMAKAAQTERTS